MLADGLNLTTIELDEGEKIPNDLSKFDGMFCMGGPMDTFMEDQYPWLVAEKKAIGEYVLNLKNCLLYTSPSPRDKSSSRMPSSA